MNKILYIALISTFFSLNGLVTYANEQELLIMLTDKDLVWTEWNNLSEFEIRVRAYESSQIQQYQLALDELNRNHKNSVITTSVYRKKKKQILEAIDILQNKTAQHIKKINYEFKVALENYKVMASLIAHNYQSSENSIKPIDITKEIINALNNTYEQSASVSHKD